MTKTTFKTKVEELKHVVILGTFLLIFWGFYRYLFKLPEEVEELVIKPIVWLLPVFYFARKEKLKLKNLGITTKNLFPAIYFALGLGLIFVLEAVFINYIKYSGFEFAADIGDKALLPALGLSFATAISEEITFRGYLFGRVWDVLGKEWVANVSTSIFWALIHVPITIFVWKLDFSASVLYLMLTTIFGIGSAFVYARTKNIASSILLHVLWEWPIILFR